MNLKSKMGPKDLHIVVNGETQNLVIYNTAGKAQFQCKARCFGQHNDWTRTAGDTPPGLYKVGLIYDTPGEAPYGRYCIDLEDLEGQETGNGRAGISLHGGGSGVPDPFAPYQGWVATHGCVRVQNLDLGLIVKQIKDAKKISGVVYLSVVYPKGKLD